MIEPRRLEWQCWEILHGGEGPRGGSVSVMAGWITAQEAAEWAAEYFDDAEKLKERCDDSAFDGGWRFIEVDIGGGTRRFQVQCELKRTYAAVEQKG